jgi:hypothetical protein
MLVATISNQSGTEVGKHADVRLQDIAIVEKPVDLTIIFTLNTMKLSLITPSVHLFLSAVAQQRGGTAVLKLKGDIIAPWWTQE